MRDAWALADEQATRRLGAALGRTCPWGARAERCVYLSGPLGSGKTTLVAALLEALGVRESVRSPSYTLVETYPLGAAQAVHVDLYRLHGPDELEQLGLRDYLQANTLLAVEWPEHGQGALPAADLHVSLAVSEPGRLCHIEACSLVGEAWLARVEQELAPSQGV